MIGLDEITAIVLSYSISQSVSQSKGWKCQHIWKEWSLWNILLNTGDFVEFKKNKVFAIVFYRIPMATSLHSIWRGQKLPQRLFYCDIGRSMNDGNWRYFETNATKEEILTNFFENAEVWVKYLEFQRNLANFPR